MIVVRVPNLLNLGAILPLLLEIQSHGVIMTDMNYVLMLARFLTSI